MKQNLEDIKILTILSQSALRCYDKKLFPLHKLFPLNGMCSCVVVMCLICI